MGPTEGLWNFEVVELFVAEAYPHENGDGQSRPEAAPVAYSEFEFSPHGHYLAWRFSGLRQRLEGEDPRVGYRAWIAEDRWHGRATFAREALPPAPWRIHAAAVHGSPSERSFEGSAPLPGSTPDFHQPGSYVLANHYRTTKRPLDQPYRATRYIVDFDDAPVVLRVGEHSPELDRRLHHEGLEPEAPWAFMTAHNPGSVLRDASDNETAQRRLKKALVERGYRPRSGRGEPVDGSWSAEPSFFVPGIMPAEALDLARAFGQAAILVGRVGDPAGLLWTEP